MHLWLAILLPALSLQGLSVSSAWMAAPAEGATSAAVYASTIYDTRLPFAG